MSDPIQMLAVRNAALQHLTYAIFQSLPPATRKDAMKRMNELSVQSESLVSAELLTEQLGILAKNLEDITSAMPPGLRK